MALAVKEQRRTKPSISVDSIRLDFVRYFSHFLTLVSTFNFTFEKNQRTPLVIEQYKQLEEMAIERVTSNVRIQRSAFAIVVMGEANERRFLLQWNANWGMFNLIGGKVDNDKGDGNSFRRTIERELEEELGVRCPEECQVGSELAQVWMKQFSYREQIEKNYHFVLFEVSILPNLPIDWDSPHYFARWLSTGRENVFVSTNEILNLSTNNGRPISATTRSILQSIGEIPHQ
jgi:8-oxo-dGTP pyrophosphatase MutT (NUDIX family)